MTQTTATGDVANKRTIERVAEILALRHLKAMRLEQYGPWQREQFRETARLVLEAIENVSVDR